MKHRSWLAVPVSLVALALAAGPSAAADPSYQVDTVHSSLVFKVKHLGTSNFYGRFNDVSGTIVLSDADPAKSSVELQVKVDSIDTANEKRDAHLKSPDFFSAKEFPLISFKSKEVKKSGANGLEVWGDFTLHGVTKPLKIKAERTGSGKSPQSGKAIAGFETVFTIKRSDFGMKNMLQGIGDEVQIMLSIEAVQK